MKTNKAIMQLNVIIDETAKVEMGPSTIESIPVKSVFIPGCGYPNVSFFQFRISQRACHRKMLLQENGNGHVWGVPALWFPERDQTSIAKAGNHPGFLHIGEIRSHPIRKEK